VSAAAAATLSRYPLAELHAIVHGPIKDRAYLNTRLGPAVQEFLAWKRLGRAADATLDQYERDLARLALAIPDTPLEEVNVTDLMLLLDLIPAGSWHRFRAAWNGMFRWGQRFGRRPDNPCDQLPELKRRNLAPVYPIFALPEQQALLNGCNASLLPAVDYARVLTLIETGARKGEARGLRLEHFDLRERIVLLHGKGSKDRLVPIRSELVQAIDRLLLEDLPTLGRPLALTDYLWFPWHVSKLGDGSRQLNSVFPERPWSERGFHEWWERRIADAEVRYRKPHMTRHTFATDLLDAEANLYDVKDLMGHESTRTTEIYVHSSRKRLNRAADRLAAYRKNPEA
jgi:site-specific recombinase XerD